MTIIGRKRFGSLVATLTSLFLLRPLALQSLQFFPLSLCLFNSFLTNWRCNYHLDKQITYVLGIIVIYAHDCDFLSYGSHDTVCQRFYYKFRSYFWIFSLIRTPFFNIMTGYGLKKMNEVSRSHFGRFF